MTMGWDETAPTVKAITPNEVVAEKQKHLPNAVFEAFNELIAAHYTGRMSEFTQDEVMNRILDKMKTKAVTREVVLNKGWLNVEEVYRHAGWDVEYDRPGYNENYAAKFIFSNR
jgi:hypothetical protein